MERWSDGVMPPKGPVATTGAEGRRNNVTGPRALECGLVGAVYGAFSGWKKSSGLKLIRQQRRTSSDGSRLVSSLASLHSTLRRT